MKSKALLLSVILFSGCVLDIHNGGYSDPPPLGETKVENQRTGYKRTGTLTIPTPPTVMPVKVVSGSEVIQYIRNQWPGIRHDAPADRQYAILDYPSVLRLAGYASDFNWEVGNAYLKESNDCDDFADAFQRGAKWALAYSHPDIQASTLCARISVKVDKGWAGIWDGYHQLNALPFFEGDTFGIIVIEPQNSTWTLAELYPNKPYKIEIE